MQPQLILRIAGIAALVIAALFAVLAVHYYFSQHIKAVMDDLSGKARAQGVAQVRGTSGGGRTSGPRHAARPTAVAPMRTCCAESKRSGMRAVNTTCSHS